MNKKMELVRIVVVNRPRECGFCKYFKVRNNNHYADYCSIMEMVFEQRGLPAWCPLEEA